MHSKPKGVGPKRIIREWTVVKEIADKYSITEEMFVDMK